MRQLLILICAAGAIGAAAEHSVDWPKANRETLEHFQALLRIDTSNPPGNETAAAEYVKRVLEREGIHAVLLGPDKTRLNLVARIRGNGSKRPLLIMGHTDVVGVQREKWTVDPFGGILKGGYIYGRGVTDDKDNVAAGLMVMLLLRRLDVPLARDVIFVAESGEEGFAAEGFRYLVERHWPDIESEYALAEGGGGQLRNGKPRYMTVAATEKVGRGVRLVARGSSGHGSVPRPDNAIAHLAQAVARASSWQPPMRLNEITRTYFERLGSISSPEQARRYNGILIPDRAPEIESYFRQHELTHNSILRTSISPNIIKGGFRGNVIPSEAEAYLDIRALPDEDMDRFYKTLKEVVDDPGIEIVAPPRVRPAAPPSRIDNEMFRALQTVQRRVYPGAITLPDMLTGATDMAPLRAKGVQAYGIGPLAEEADALKYGAHTDDERVSEAALYKFAELLWNTVVEVSGR